MRAPRFWQHGGALPNLLAPAAALYAAATAGRLRRPGWRAPAPVICCGGATAGGAGKTPLALDLGVRLQARGRSVAFLTRGYGGSARGVLSVDPARHDAARAGDEALLLAAVAPTFVAADRAAAARAAIASGADMLVMDDGLQHPRLAQDLSLLVIDGGAGFGNGRVIPAGPLREPVARAASRCQAAVLIGEDDAHAGAALPPTLPVLRARLAAAPDPAMHDARVVGFAGIARPEKFFATLRETGASMVGEHAFADHHRFAPGQVEALLRDAEDAGATLVTTAKDAVRLAPALRRRVHVLRVHLVWEHPAAIECLLDQLT